jgi:hypothetical protein
LSSRCTADQLSGPLAVAVVAGATTLSPVLTGLDPVPLVGFLLVLRVAATPVQLRREWSVPVSAAVPPLLAALVLDLTAAIDGMRADIAVMVPAVNAETVLL